MRAFGPAFERENLAGEQGLEFVNLTGAKVGLSGTVRITSAYGQVEPRVSWFADRPYEHVPGFAVSLEESPRVVAHDLRGIESAPVTAMLDWVALNWRALKLFWDEGEFWMIEDVSAHARRLKPLPR